MSLASRLASIPQFSNMRALLADVEQLEQRSDALDELVKDVHDAWFHTAAKNYSAPETISIQFTREMTRRDVFQRAYNLRHLASTSAARERACITCSAVAQRDIFHNDDAGWPAGHVKSGLYKEEWE